MPIIIECERCGERQSFSHIGKSKHDPAGEYAADTHCNLAYPVTCQSCSEQFAQVRASLEHWHEHTLRFYMQAAITAWLNKEPPPECPPPPNLESIDT